MSYPPISFSLPEYSPSGIGTGGYTVPPVLGENRYFLTFPGVNQYVSIPEVTLTGDFEIVVSFLASSPGVRVFGTESSVDGRLFLRVADGSSTAINAGIFFGSSFPAILTQDNFIAANQFNTVSIRRTGDVMTLTNLLTGASESGAGFSGVAGKINTIGRHLGNYFDGVLANLSISDNGTPVRFYPLDDNSTVIRNALSSLGANIYTGQDPFDSVLIGGQTLSTYPVGSVESGKTYIASVEISNYSGVGTVGFVAGSGISTGGNSRASDGSLTVVFTATGNATINLFNRDTNQCTFSSISLREADGYGTYINGAASDWELFTRQPNGDWLGVELITQLLWENPFAAEDQWSFSNNQWTLTGDGSLNILQPVPTGDQSGFLRVSGNVASIDQNRLAIVRDGAPGNGQIETSGPYSFDFNVDDLGQQQFKRAGGVVTATIDKPSLRRLLRTA